MARNSKKSFPSKSLVAKGGEIYCHVFENQHTGLARNLFWSVTVDFEPIKYGDSDFDCSLTCEWITWPVRSWRDLDGRHLDVFCGQDGIESSFYMTEHDIANRTKLSLRHVRENIFRVTVDMEVDFHGYLGGDENPEMPVHSEVDVEFIGLLITPGNLTPKPSTSAEVQSVAAQFVDLAANQKPEPWKKHGFILRPKLTEQ